MSDIIDRVWPELQEALRALPKDENGRGILEVGLSSRKSVNKVKVEKKHLVRCSSGPNSVDRPIPADDFRGFAREAIESPSRQFCITGEGMKRAKHVKRGGRGSFVCTALSLLPYFAYSEGQILEYLEDKT
ncbi:MAG: hypothetical protein QGH30_03915 [Candidatus Krumholzibacteria bacterium]|nr:hypothetical protein [Candidatus Krumholzibacteria bacterium]